jgi:hypothetical protein
VPDDAHVFEWDENKNRQNLLKHDVRFETAVLVFDDPHALTQRDQSCNDEERWITLGAVGTELCFLSCTLGA